MKTRRTTTEKVIAANRRNAEKATGPRTPHGKELASRNATKHGILARNLHFRSDREKAAFDRLVSKLRKRIRSHDPFLRMLAEELAVSHLRRGRALKLEQKLLQHRNPATELALSAVENLELLKTAAAYIDPDSRWDATELTVATKKDDKRLVRRGPAANSSADGQQLQVHAKFQDPMEKALRYQRATSRDFYRAFTLLYGLLSRKKPESAD